MGWIHFKDLYNEKNTEGLPFAPFIYKYTNYYKTIHLISFLPERCGLRKTLADKNSKNGRKSPVTTKETGSHALYYPKKTSEEHAWLAGTDALYSILESTRRKIADYYGGKFPAAEQISRLKSFIADNHLSNVIETIFDLKCNGENCGEKLRENFADICGLIVYLAIAEVDFYDGSEISCCNVINASELKTRYQSALNGTNSEEPFLEMSIIYNSKVLERLSDSNINLNLLFSSPKENLEESQIGWIHGLSGVGKSRTLKKINERLKNTILIVASELNADYREDKKDVLLGRLGEKQYDYILIDGLNELKDRNPGSYVKLVNEISQMKGKRFLIATREELVDSALSNTCRVKRYTLKCTGITDKNIKALFEKKPSIKGLYPNMSMTKELLQRPLYYEIASHCGINDSIRGKYGLFKKYYETEMKGDGSNLALRLAKEYIIPVIAEHIGVSRVNRKTLLETVRALYLDEKEKGYLGWLFSSKDDKEGSRIIATLDQIREYGIAEDSQDALTNPSVMLDLILRRNLFKERAGKYGFFHEDIADMLTAYRIISLEDYMLSCSDADLTLLAKLPDNRGVLDFYLEGRGILIDVSINGITRSIIDVKKCFGTYVNEMIAPAIKKRSDEEKVHLCRLVLEMYEAIQSSFKASGVSDFDFTREFAKNFVSRTENILNAYMYGSNLDFAEPFKGDIVRLSERVLQNARLEGNLDSFKNLSVKLLDIPEIRNQKFKTELDALQKYVFSGMKDADTAFISRLLNADGTLNADRVMTEIEKEAARINYPMSYNIGGNMSMYPTRWMLENGFSINPDKSLEFYLNAIRCNSEKFDGTYRQYSISKVLDLLVICYDKLSKDNAEKDADITDLMERARFLQIPLKNIYGIFARRRNDFNAITFEDMEKVADAESRCNNYIVYWAIRLILLVGFRPKDSKDVKKCKDNLKEQIETCKKKLKEKIDQALVASYDVITKGGNYDRKMPLYYIFDVLTLLSKYEGCGDQIKDIKEYIYSCFERQSDSVKDCVWMIQNLLN